MIKQPVADKIRNWVNSRANVDGLIDAALHVTIPAGVRTYFLGGLTPAARHLAETAVVWDLSISLLAFDSFHL